VTLASRLHWRLLVGTILALMALAPLAGLTPIRLTPTWLRPPAIQENRPLADRPAWPRGLAGVHAFRKRADAYVADHFPLRPYLIGALNRLRMLVGVSGSNRVIVGRDGWLFYDDDSHLGGARGVPPLMGPEVRSWLVTLAGRSEYARAHGATYLIVTPPSKETIYPQFGPAWYRGPSPERATVLLPRLARETGAGEVLYLYPEVERATEAGQKTFSRHDTHWTSYGAYAGYVGLMRRLHAQGLTDAPRPLSDFQKADPGQWGPRDLALMLGVASFVDLDYPHYENYAGEAKQRVTYLSDKRDWTAPRVIDTGEVGKPVLLLVRDSFSNELLPFLLSHFSRIVLVHSQQGFWRQDLIDRYQPSIIIFEVIESGLHWGAGDGPPASPEAIARVDRVLASTPQLRTAGGSAPTMPQMVLLDAKRARIAAAAAPRGDCNVESAVLTPGVGGEATFALSGWFSELGRQVTSPDGFVVLKGSASSFVGDLRMDKARPDVAAYYKNPTGLQSGFVQTYYLRKVPAGAYALSVYRRSGPAWIGCAGTPTLVAP